MNETLDTKPAVQTREAGPFRTVLPQVSALPELIRDERFGSCVRV